jgi:hypothetical protein
MYERLYKVFKKRAHSSGKVLVEIFSECQIMNYKYLYTR